MLFALTLLLALPLAGQTQIGELHLHVTDSSGLALSSEVELISDANQIHERLQTDANGTLVAKRLAFGVYQVIVKREGFSTETRQVELRSALPTQLYVTLGVAGVQAQVTVGAEATSFDPHQPTVVHRVGAEMLQRRALALPGRSLPDLVDTQPGWLLEANGILHPRGSEYQTQFVVDGLPLTDNRSPAFAPEIDAADVHSMAILTGGYPAEYGRKLGGVIEVITARQIRQGFHANAGLSIGSFATRALDAGAAHSGPRTSVSATASIAETDRYLDPPVEENHANHGASIQTAVSFEHDFAPGNRAGVIVRRGQSRFLVPNERVQQEAGQRQDRDAAETMGQFSYQHILSSRVLADVRGLLRTLSAGLWSNPTSTPIVAAQDRGFREAYVKASISAHTGAHEWKFGGDVDAGTIREQFSYTITDPGEFDRETPRTFDFTGREANREQSLFVQDQMRLGAWTVNAGLRWDRYRLLVDDNAFSPRLGAAWHWPAVDLVVRASYDRAFQTPAIENLLLASAPGVDALNDEVLHLPVPPSRGDFFEGGFSKRIARTGRLHATYFRRILDNAADDDVLLNTGVSFPIAFHEARISGTEIKLDAPRWRDIAASLSYSNMHGVGELPITGGLFLGEEGDGLLEATDRFAISQDQRHTVRARASWQLTPAAWLAIATAYGSGLPVESEGDDDDDAVAQFGQRIVDRVDVDRQRVRPSLSLDASAGFVFTRAGRELNLQIDVRNLTNRLNVINFAGLFSGTALAPPRSLAVSLRARF